MPPGGQRVDQLGLRPGDVLDGADELEVRPGAMFVITPMSGLRERREPGDLAERRASPISTMQTSVSGSIRQSVSGTPSSLL